MQIFSYILKEYVPYLAVLIIGILIGWRGCGDSQPAETVTIEKPVPKIEYVDRWKRDTTRFTKWIIERDTVVVSDTTIDVRLDTLLKVDTLKIVETWLTEVAKYDTTLNYKHGSINLSWQNYQNLSENLKVTLTQRSNQRNFGAMIYAKGGIHADFKASYTPVIGVGLLFEKKRFIFGADYGYSGQHNINGVVGYRLR